MEIHPRTVHVNGTELSYVEEGQGAPVVLVHGSLGDIRSWGFQIEPFARYYRTIAYSRRGHWPNAALPGGTPYAVADHVADLGALIDSLDLGPVHLVGASFGAMTALTLTVARPALVRTLVLGEPPLLPWIMDTPDGKVLYTDFDARAWQPARAAFQEGDQQAGVRLFIDGVIGEGGFNRLPPPAQAMMMDNAGEMSLEMATSPASYFPALTPDDVRNVRLPTLLLRGELSPRMFLRVLDELAGCLPMAERATIPNASHAMQLGNPQAYTYTVLAFLARNGRAGTSASSE